MNAPYLVQTAAASPNAAASPTAALQAGLGRESQVTPGLTIEDLKLFLLLLLRLRMFFQKNP